MTRYAAWKLRPTSGFDRSGEATSLTAIASGGLLGITVGMNYQVNETVIVGVEANRSSGSDIAGDGSIYERQTTQETQLNSISTIRARLGYLLSPSTLAYVTGGLAVADIDTLVCGRSYCYREFRDPGKCRGYTVGGGVEHAFGDHWRLKAEGLYHQLQALHYEKDYAYYNVDNSGVLARIGLNYAF